MKVFVVYYNDYDSSRNVGVFDSYSKASAFINVQIPEGDRVNYDIQEWELE